VHPCSDLPRAAEARGALTLRFPLASHPARGSEARSARSRPMLPRSHRSRGHGSAGRYRAEPPKPRRFGLTRGGSRQRTNVRSRILPGRTSRPRPATGSCRRGEQGSCWPTMVPTVTRRPRTQGLPPMTSGSNVIRVSGSGIEEVLQAQHCRDGDCSCSGVEEAGPDVRASQRRSCRSSTRRRAFRACVRSSVL
jgi:hypothetical protein